MRNKYNLHAANILVAFFFPLSYTHEWRIQLVFLSSDDILHNPIFSRIILYSSKPVREIDNFVITNIFILETYEISHKADKRHKAVWNQDDRERFILPLFSFFFPLPTKNKKRRRKQKKENGKQDGTLMMGVVVKKLDI